MCATVKINRIKVNAEQALEERREQVYLAVTGWTISCTLAVSILTWLATQVEEYTLLSFGLTLLIAGPLSYFLARRSQFIRAKGDLLLCLLILAGMAAELWQTSV